MESQSTGTAPAGFTEHVADVEGASLHFLRGGSGPAVVLIHGFPQDSSAWRDVAARLARRYTVVVPDVRGVGRSRAHQRDGFDAATLASDIDALLAGQHLRRPYIVGHDMGGIIAFAYAARYPDRTRGAMLIENPLPGIPPWDEIAADPKVWHINFQRMPELPELLISGREAVYFRKQYFDGGLDDPGTIDETALRRYVAAYASREQLQAGLAQYRATPRNARYNTQPRGTIDVPLALVGTRESLGRAMEVMREDLTGRGWSKVEAVVLAGRSHYLADERPGDIAALIEQRAATSGTMQ